jgi:uncharacterized membrane protein YgcG
MSWRGLAARLVVAVAAIALALPASVHDASAADEGWVITSWQSDITIETDATIWVVEDIRANFQTPGHGIYRTIPTRFAYDKTHNRRVELTVESITDGSRPLQFQASDTGSAEQLRIGDPNRTVTGAQRYVITYAVKGAMNAFQDHDELYWNVDSAESPVAKNVVLATVHVPSGSLQKVTCYEGPPGSTAPCQSSTATDAATFRSTSSVAANEVMTIVIALDKGAVTVPPPMLEALPTIRNPFEINPFTVGSSLLILVLGVGFAAWNWWRRGRDREYLSQYYLKSDGHDRIEPLFHHDVIAVEFEPPEHMRPAQLGLILDERADTKDVTATIVDLAVRGYLTIKEVPAAGIFGKKDFVLTWRGAADMNALAPYERTILNGLFEGLPERKLSDLKGKFKPTLDNAENQIYQDATQRKLFTSNPKNARLLWMVLGMAVTAVGVLFGFFLGPLAGLGIPALALTAVGVILMVFGYSMPQRSAAGRDVLHRTLGFRLYMTTAERYRQQFAEKAQIFTQLLPYAIVFGCVTQWARAFQGIDTSAADGWYVGPGPLQAAFLATALESFNSSLSTTIASTPAGSGASGFGGGGFSGGGFGGGGIGRW